MHSAGALFFTESLLFRAEVLRSLYGCSRIKMSMTETAFGALQRLYSSPRFEGVVGWHIAQALEKLDLVKVAPTVIHLPPTWGTTKRLVRLTRAGQLMCRRRIEAAARISERLDGARRVATAPPSELPRAFLLGIRST